MSSNGTTAAPPRRIASSSRWDHGPHFSPDGKRIAFGSTRGGTMPDIWIADADGANPTRLTYFDRTVAGTPRWSPDGQWIAFDASVRGNWDIFIVRAMGGTPTPLTSDPANMPSPAGRETDAGSISRQLAPDRGRCGRCPRAADPPVIDHEGRRVWRLRVGGRHIPLLQQGRHRGRCLARAGRGRPRGARPSRPTRLRVYALLGARRERPLLPEQHEPAATVGAVPQLLHPDDH